MKILYLSPWFPYPADNGFKQRIHHLLRALTQKHHVTLAAFAFGTARPEQAHHHPNQTTIPIPANPFQRSPLAHRTRFLSPTPIVEKPHPLAQKYLQPLQTQPFDIIIAASTQMATYALTAHTVAQSTPLKLLEEHNLMTQIAWERYQRQTHPLRRLQAQISWRKRKRYDTHLFSRFHHCTMVSDKDKIGAEQLTNTPITLIPNGVDCEWNRPGQTPITPHTLIYNGALTYQANFTAMQHFLDQTYPLIQAQNPHVTLRITGSTNNVPLNQLNTNPTVHFTDYLPDIRPTIASSTICVVPLLEGGGSRLKILEAMALGTPVIATTKGAEGLAITPGRNILIADTPTHFAQHTLNLLQNQPLRHHLTTHARHFVQTHHNWSKIGQTFTTLLENLITNPQSPTTNPQSPITNHQSPITNHQSPTTNPQSPIPNPQSPITNHQSLTTNH